MRLDKYKDSLSALEQAHRDIAIAIEQFHASNFRRAEEAIDKALCRARDAKTELMLDRKSKTRVDRVWLKR